MINAHPALKAVSPQAPIADWFFDDFHHHGAFFLPHAFDFFASFGRPRPEPTTKRPRRPSSNTAPTTATSSYLDIGSLEQRQHEVFQEQDRLLERDGRASQLRRLLASPQPPAAPQECRSRGDDRRRLVRRRGPVRHVQHLPGRREAEPATSTSSSWAPGSTAAGRGRRATSLATFPLARAPSEYYQNEIELPFFNHFLKGKGEHKLPEAYDVRDRRQPVAQVRRLAAERRGHEPSSFSTPAASWRQKQPDGKGEHIRRSSSAIPTSRCPTPRLSPLPA